MSKISVKILKSIFYIFYFNVLLSQSYAFGGEVSADQDMFEIAQPHQSTMKLTAHTRLGEHFSGSAVYIGKNKTGDYIALTNAHCVEFWYRATHWLASFSIDHVIEGKTSQQFHVIGVEFHPKRFSNPKNNSYDIVKLKLSSDDHPDDTMIATPYFGLETNLAPSSFSEFEPFDESALGPKPQLSDEYEKLKKTDDPKDYERRLELISKYNEDHEKYYNNFFQAQNEYYEKLKKATEKRLKPFEEKSFVAVGYGTGGPNSVTTFSKNDHKKRGTNVRILGYGQVKEQNVNCFLVSEPYQLKYNFEKSLYEDIDIQLSNAGREYGTRYGMSGGGLYEVHQDNHEISYQLIGICRGGGFLEGSFMRKTLLKAKGFYANRLGKYGTAAGIPMPFMNPLKGQTSVFISLSPLEEWINCPVVSNGQTSRQYFQSWVPDRTTSALLFGTASVFGFMMMSYFG